jgi:hypothetical protein
MRDFYLQIKAVKGLQEVCKISKTQAYERLAKMKYDALKDKMLENLLGKLNLVLEGLNENK